MLINKTTVAGALMAAMVGLGTVACSQKKAETKSSAEMLQEKPANEMTEQELNAFNNLRFQESCKFYGIDPNAPDANARLFDSSMVAQQKLLLNLDKDKKEYNEVSNMLTQYLYEFYGINPDAPDAKLQLENARQETTKRLIEDYNGFIQNKAIKELLINMQKSM